MEINRETIIPGGFTKVVKRIIGSALDQKAFFPSPQPNEDMDEQSSDHTLYNGTTFLTVRHQRL